MSRGSTNNRIDQASRTILATPKSIFQAMTSAEALSSWRPPDNMTAQFDTFDPRPDGEYRMILFYPAELAGQGKSGPDRDVIRGRFLEMLPFERIVEEVQFDSDDPAFDGAMRITTSLAPLAGGTKVTVSCENVPAGISAADHEAGLASTLKKLALFVE